MPSLGNSLWDCVGLLGWREGVTRVVGLSVLRRCSGGSGRVARGDPILTGSLAGSGLLTIGGGRDVC